MEVIHDWNDQDAVRILKNVRRAAGGDARLLLIETIVPDSSGPDWSQMLDIHMLAFVGGKQRTIGEYRTLVGDAAFELVADVDTGAGISVLDAVPV
jgi:O-methyltransferase